MPENEKLHVALKLPAVSLVVFTIHEVWFTPFSPELKFSETTFL
jgi:hypothetical protein